MPPRIPRLLLLISVSLLLLAATPSHPSLMTAQPAPARPQGVQIRVFQQGADGYTGLADTWISANDWADPPQHTVNYCLNPTLTLSRDGDDNPLLRFDLTDIPGNSAILTATLSLYNTSQSSPTAKDFARRVEAFSVLKDWDEGNQIESPINASGKHGATGDNAFDYFTGQGTDIPWSAQGMASGTDYATAPMASADVINPGWYEWDVTDLVRSWVRNEQPNFGLVLRDATGYQDDHNDQRIFVSGQGANAAQRPKLTVTFNPDVPFADAGPDQSNLNWDRTAITLDGSASHDRPGGNDGAIDPEALNVDHTEHCSEALLPNRVQLVSKPSRFRGCSVAPCGTTAPSVAVRPSPAGTPQSPRNRRRLRTVRGGGPGRGGGCAPTATPPGRSTLPPAPTRVRP